jgi:hypothetical protein
VQSMRGTWLPTLGMRGIDTMAQLSAYVVNPGQPRHLGVIPNVRQYNSIWSDSKQSCEDGLLLMLSCKIAVGLRVL